MPPKQTPKGWPPSTPYFSSPVHHSLSPSRLAALRSPPTPPTPPSISSSTSNTNSYSYSGGDIPILAASLTPTPSPLVRIQRISDPSHPAFNQHGLFATKDLAPGSLILPYLGIVHSSSSYANSNLDTSESDYDLWLDKPNDIAVDAALGGNEARFVNDYRGISGRPNALFRNAYCQRWGQICVTVWVVGQAQADNHMKPSKPSKNTKNRTNSRGIRKGEEILVSYGKGFWEERRKEATDTTADSYS